MTNPIGIKIFKAKNEKKLEEMANEWFEIVKNAHIKVDQLHMNGNRLVLLYSNPHQFSIENIEKYHEENPKTDNEG